MKMLRCPSCFARDVDVVFLVHDPRRDEYYCNQCTFSGSAEEVEARFATYLDQRYKQRNEEHPFHRQFVAKRV